MDDANQDACSEHDQPQGDDPHEDKGGRDELFEQDWIFRHTWFAGNLFIFAHIDLMIWIPPYSPGFVWICNAGCEGFD